MQSLCILYKYIRTRSVIPILYAKVRLRYSCMPTYSQQQCDKRGSESSIICRTRRLKNDARGILSLILWNNIYLLLYQSTAASKYLKRGQELPPLLIFKNNESPAYLQGQRDSMILHLAASPWSKKWTNTWLSEFAEILVFTQYAFKCYKHKALFWRLVLVL